VRRLGSSSAGGPPLGKIPYPAAEAHGLLLVACCSLPRLRSRFPERNRGQAQLIVFTSAR